MLAMKICCGIVTYNPKISLLKKNILAIKDQVSEIFIVDNGSINLNEIILLIKKFKSINLINNKKNMGIAYALNQLCLTAVNRKYDWILTLDQDSVCPPKFVYSLSRFISQNIGIVAPIIVDRNVGIIGHEPTNKPQEVRTCITSGALTNLNAWKQINGFDENMFIDSVDSEYCYRLRKSGFKILQVPNVKLAHSIGNAKKCQFLFWNFIDTEHSAFRAYYIAQNNIYYPKKHNLILRLLRGNFRNLKYVFIVLVYEKNKREKVRAIFKGWKRGYTLSAK